MRKAYVVYHFQVAYSAVPVHRRRRALTLCLTLMQDTDNSDHAAQRRRPNIIWEFITEIKMRDTEFAEHHPAYSQVHLTHVFHTHRKCLDTVDANSNMVLTFSPENYTALDS